MNERLTSGPMSRRDILRTAGGGFGLVGLAGALGKAATVDHVSPLLPKAPHFPARAKHVIYLFLSGGLSQIDSFDYKPTLDKYDGKPLPYDLPLTQFATGNLM